MTTDILIIGSGIAGLNTACQLAKLRPDFEIVIATKSTLENSNSAKAQGGIAIPKNDPDSLQKHVADTFLAGDQFADPKLIEDILKDAHSVLEQMELYDLQFDMNSSGTLDRTIEGGHSERRIVHVKDFTGKAMINAMIKTLKGFKNITILENHISINLLQNEDPSHGFSCIGSTFVSTITGEVNNIFAKATILATGGIGSLYKSSTNIAGTNGEGLVLAHDIGAELSNLEFVQFHPTGLSAPKQTVPLISEALRGEGAHLVNEQNERFMSKYDPRMELAPRDIVSRAIVFELINDDAKHVYLDATHMNTDKFMDRFPEIYKICSEANIDPRTDRIPVVPIQHFHCGGIETDTMGRTNINSLFACGECACTSLHGANRLASNSLLEALIISKRVAELVSEIPDYSSKSTTTSKYSAYSLADNMYFEKLNLEIQDILTNEVGIIRTKNGLNYSMERLREIENAINQATPEERSLHYHVLKSKVKSAMFITQSALLRDTNCGCHFNINDQEQSQQIISNTTDQNGHFSVR